MAIAFVQALSAGVTTNTTNNATIAITTNAAASAGDLIVIVCAQRLGAAAPISSVSGGGVTWSVPAGASATGGATARACSLAYGFAPAGGVASGSTITVTLTASSSRKVAMICEYSGIDSASPLDQATGQDKTTAGLDSGSVTTTQADELLIGGYGQIAAAGTDTITATNSFTMRQTGIVGTSNWEIGGLADRIVAATGAYNATATTTSTTTNSDTIIATFKGAAAAVVPPPRPIVVSQAIQRAVNW